MARALAAAERALLVAGFLILLFVLPHGLEGDDGFRFTSISQLLDHGTFNPDERSMLAPLVSVPVLELSHIAGSRTTWATHFNVLVIAAGALAAWLLLRRRLDTVVLRRTLLILIAASFLTNRLRSYDAAVLAGTLIALGVICVRIRRWLSAGWALMAVGAAMAPIVLVALLPVAVVDAITWRRLRPFVWLAAGGLLVAAEDWVRRGSPFDTGYGGTHGYQTILAYSGRPGFSYPLLLGVASILFSFGRGLLFFMPGLTLWVDRRNRDAAGAFRPLLSAYLAIVAALVLVYAKWWSWYGGVTWGPRFFVFAALPASMLVALRLGRGAETLGSDVFVVAVLALSSWVAYTGATSDYTQTPLCVQHHYALESMCWYEPTRSGLWWPLVHGPLMTWQRTLLAVWCAATFATLALPVVYARLAALRVPRPSSAWAAGWRL